MGRKMHEEQNKQKSIWLHLYTAGDSTEMYHPNTKTDVSLISCRKHSKHLKLEIVTF